MTKSNDELKSCRFEDALGKIMRGEVRQTKKLEKCVHGLYGYEDCENCISDYIQEVLLTSDCTRANVIPTDGDVCAWLDEHGRVVCREDKQGGGVVGINRAIPSKWKPLLSASQNPSNTDGDVERLEDKIVDILKEARQPTVGNRQLAQEIMAVIKSLRARPMLIDDLFNQMIAGYEQDLIENDHSPLSKIDKLTIRCFFDFIEAVGYLTPYASMPDDVTVSRQTLQGVKEKLGRAGGLGAYPLITEAIAMLDKEMDKS